MEWSTNCTMFLCSKGEEDLFEGKAPSLEPESISSVGAAVEQLNQGVIEISQDGVVVFSSNAKGYYLLYRHGKKDSALAMLGLKAHKGTLVKDTGELSELLAAPRKELKCAVEQAFHAVAGSSRKISFDQTRQFRMEFLKILGLPAKAISDEDFATTCERFDFDGSGTLETNELYILVKWSLFDFMKQLGAVPPIDIPTKTPKQAGLDIQKELGEGSQGVVMLVIDSHGKERCLKCYTKEGVQLGGLAGLKEEFEAMKLLACKHIGHVDELFQDSHFFYMLGDIYSGGDFLTLKERAQRQHVCMSEEWWRRIFFQCFKGLEFMHQQAMIHCDIKEDNLMLKDEHYETPHVMIIDLGVSVAMARKPTGDCAGTPGYVPPETYDLGKWFPVGDIFSMGVVMVQMVIDPHDVFFSVGCRSIEEIASATFTREPPFEKVPYEGLEQLCKQCLDKNKDTRPRIPKVLHDPWFHGATLPHMEACNPMAGSYTLPESMRVDA